MKDHPDKIPFLVASSLAPDTIDFIVTTTDMEKISLTDRSSLNGLTLSTELPHASETKEVTSLRSIVLTVALTLAFCAVLAAFVAVCRRVIRHWRRRRTTAGGPGLPPDITTARTSSVSETTQNQPEANEDSPFLNGAIRTIVDSM